MSEAERAGADDSTWAVHFPGNLRWSNAMQIVKGMAPYAAVAMDEVDRVGRRLKARAALASEASGQRGNSIVRAPDTRPEPGSSARAAFDRGSPRHPGFHKTSSVDYAIVLAGEIYALMDEGEVLLKEGDVLVQRGTNHAWSNRSDAPAYLAFMLIDAEPL
jgi:quercetin dioxygenase-like cupin family protein